MNRTILKPIKIKEGIVSKEDLIRILAGTPSVFDYYNYGDIDVSCNVVGCKPGCVAGCSSGSKTGVCNSCRDGCQNGCKNTCQNNK